MDDEIKRFTCRSDTTETYGLQLTPWQCRRKSHECLPSPAIRMAFGE